MVLLIYTPLTVARLLPTQIQATALPFGRVSSLSEPIPCCGPCQAARLPRIDLPDIPQHIVQRGNNRLPCFLDDGDRLRYLNLLHEALQATGCKLHAYVSMDNHVHLLITPPAAGRIGQLMQRLGRTTSRCSMAPTGAPVRYGRDATKPALWTVPTTCFAAIATLSSTQCALA